MIIPLYNSATTIGPCLEAILRNDVARIDRVVVVVDHRTDHSAEVAHSYVARYAAAGAELQIVPLPASRTGKVAAILEGGTRITTPDALLLDENTMTPWS